MTISGKMIQEARRFATAPNSTITPRGYKAIIHPLTFSDIGIQQPWWLGDIAAAAETVIHEGTG